MTGRTSNQENIMRTSIVLIIGALALGGCASSQANRQPAAAEPQAAPPPMRPQQGTRGGSMGGDMAGMCPMAVEGTTVRAEDVEGGAAIVFTTTGDVAELRRRVAHMADMHNQHHGDGHGHMMGMHGMMAGGMMMPPATARSEEIEGGARLVLTPRDPAELANLRQHVHQHAEQMASGRCPMMSMHGQGAEAAPPSEPSEHETHRPEGDD
jgi:hypothetical protein